MLKIPSFMCSVVPKSTVGHAGATDVFMCIFRMVISGTDK